MAARRPRVFDFHFFSSDCRCVRPARTAGTIRTDAEFLARPVVDQSERSKTAQLLSSPRCHTIFHVWGNTAS